MNGRALVITSAICGGMTAVLAMGWMGAVLLTAAILIPIGALCWILADRDRPLRLALLLSAWRHGTISAVTAAEQPLVKARRKPNRR